MRTITQQTIAAALVLALAFTFNACSSSDDEGGSSGGGSSLESLLANDYEYQQWKKELEYYNPDRGVYDELQRCTNGVVEFLCENTASGDVWYNPLRQGCYDYDDSDSSELGTMEVCGSEIYIKLPSGNYHNRKCGNNVLLERCRDEWYNRQTHFCSAEYDSSTDEYSYSIKPVDPKDLCNGVRFSYEEGYRECRDGVVKLTCGGIWYNVFTEYCDRQDGNKVKPAKCDGMYMDTEDLFKDRARCATDGKTTERKCELSNGVVQWYNPITQACSYNGGSYTLKNKIKCSK